MTDLHKKEVAKLNRLGGMLAHYNMPVSSVCSTESDKVAQARFMQKLQTIPAVKKKEDPYDTLDVVKCDCQGACACEAISRASGVSVILRPSVMVNTPSIGSYDSSEYKRSVLIERLESAVYNQFGFEEDGFIEDDYVPGDIDLSVHI